MADGGASVGLPVSGGCVDLGGSGANNGHSCPIEDHHRSEDGGHHHELSHTTEHARDKRGGGRGKREEGRERERGRSGREVERQREGERE